MFDAFDFDSSTPGAVELVLEREGLLSPLELMAVDVARLDARQIRRRGRLSPRVAGLFGLSSMPRPLADPELEALRSAVVAALLCGSDPLAELRTHGLSGERALAVIAALRVAMP